MSDKKPVMVRSPWDGRMVPASEAYQNYSVLSSQPAGPFSQPIQSLTPYQAYAFGMLPNYMTQPKDMTEFPAMWNSHIPPGFSATGSDAYTSDLSRDPVLGWLLGKPPYIDPLTQDQNDRSMQRSYQGGLPGLLGVLMRSGEDKKK